MPLPDYTPGERLRITDGPFTGRDGVVRAVEHHPPRLRVDVTLFGRPIPIEVESWQVAPAKCAKA
jgi:transcription termination/antitermination protein NusG